MAQIDQYGRGGAYIPPDSFEASHPDKAERSEAIVAHKSGATSSHFSPFSFYCTYEGTKLATMRFKEGNRKHENCDPVYSEANWLKAYHAKDVEFFRDRAGHALEHLIDEMRGKDDSDPGGNLGAVGWWVDIMAFVKKNDPAFYERIQGKSPKQPGRWPVNSNEAAINGERTK